MSKRKLADNPDFMAAIATSVKISNEWRVRPKPAESRHEVVECPICAGQLHLTQSSYNGHVHGSCETYGCLSWME